MAANDRRCWQNSLPPRPPRDTHARSPAYRRSDRPGRPAGPRPTYQASFGSDTVQEFRANLFHDLHETLGRYHYQMTPDMSDEDLQDAQVGRFYDTLASEHEYREADEWVGNFANTVDHSRPYSTREFLHLLGRELSEIATEDGILTSAYKAKVPVFCPDVADSAIAVGIATSRINRKNPFQFDIV